MKDVNVDLTNFIFLCSVQDKYFDLIQHDLVSEKNDYFMKFRWFLSCIGGVSQKEEYLEKAEINLIKWWDIARHETCKSEYYFWEGTINALRNKQEESRNSFNRSKLIDSHTHMKLTKEIGANGMSWGSIIESYRK